MSIVDQIKSMGFNTIRVPFSGQMLSRTASPIAVNHTLSSDSFLPAGDVDYTLNSGLVGLTPLQCLDALVDYCGRVGIRIILTRSSCYADGQYKEPLWFVAGDAYFTQQQYIADWQLLARRYAGKDDMFSCSHIMCAHLMFLGYAVV
jgi:aryl-phospho-beta-D-glucosidase BglC (GH1 family)